MGQPECSIISKLKVNSLIINKAEKGKQSSLPVFGFSLFLLPLGEISDTLLSWFRSFIDPNIQICLIAVLEEVTYVSGLFKVQIEQIIITQLNHWLMFHGNSVISIFNYILLKQVLS